MLDETLVFFKTEFGAAEITSTSRTLSSKLRRALIMVDGVKSVADLAPLFRPGEIDSILAELQAGGYVALAGGAIAEETPEPSPGGTEATIGPGPFEEVRRRAMREISDRLGPNGDTLALRIERCTTREELRVALREAEKILSSFLGAEYGRKFSQKVGGDLL